MATFTCSDGAVEQTKYVRPYASCLPVRYVHDKTKNNTNNNTDKKNTSELNNVK